MNLIMMNSVVLLPNYTIVVDNENSLKLYEQRAIVVVTRYKILIAVISLRMAMI